MARFTIFCYDKNDSDKIHHLVCSNVSEAAQTFAKSERGDLARAYLCNPEEADFSVQCSDTENQTQSHYLIEDD